MTERSRRASWIAVGVFGGCLTGLLSAATWFAQRDAASARLELAGAASQPVRPLQGASFSTTSSAYSVAPPPLVQAIQDSPLSSGSASAAAAPSSTAAASPDAGGYLPVSFRKLAGFDYDLKAMSKIPAGTTGTAERARSLPADVQALDEKKVSVTGFMMPIEFSEGRVRSFLLMKNQLLCCFGIAPRLNDFVAVRVNDKGGAPSAKDVPVTAKGVLQVGEVVNNGIPLALYTMVADEVVTAQ